MNTDNENRSGLGMLSVVVIVLGVLTVMYLLFCVFPKHSNILNDFGGFFGGVLGTIVLIVTLNYAYKTYQDSQKNQIENRFFQLLKVVGDTRNNLLKADANIFTIYIKYIGVFYKKISKYKTDNNKDWTKEDVLKLSYLYFFHGIIKLESGQIKNIDSIDFEDIPQVKIYLDEQGYKIDHAVFKDLGIYFRQLFQTVTYINDRKELTYSEKYHLIKILRSTINIEEQYLLFVNSITPLGLDWEKGANKKNNKLITKYCLIKNIPEHYKPIDGILFNDKEYGYPNVHYEFSGSKKTCKRKRLESKYE